MQPSYGGHDHRERHRLAQNSDAPAVKREAKEDWGQ